VKMYCVIAFGNQWYHQDKILHDQLSCWEGIQTLQMLLRITIKAVVCLQ